MSAYESDERVEERARPSKALQNLIDFVFGSPDEVVEMTLAEIDAELIEEGVDIRSARAKLHRRLTEIRAKRDPSEPTEVKSECSEGLGT